MNLRVYHIHCSKAALSHTHTLPQQQIESCGIAGAMDVSEVTSLHRSNVAASNGVAHKFGGSIDNAVVEKRSLDPTQACETCVLCCRLLGRACFWPEQWRHRTRDDIKMKCQECSPTCPKGQPTGYLQLNEQRSREAAAKPLTCQVCERTMPRTQFRPGKNGKFDLRKPKTCEQCRAEGKLPTSGWKKRSLE